MFWMMPKSSLSVLLQYINIMIKSNKGSKKQQLRTLDEEGFEINEPALVIQKDQRRTGPAGMIFSDLFYSHQFISSPLLNPLVRKQQEADIFSILLVPQGLEKIYDSLKLLVPFMRFSHIKGRNPQVEAQREVWYIYRFPLSQFLLFIHRRHLIHRMVYHSFPRLERFVYPRSHYYNSPHCLFVFYIRYFQQSD